MALQPTVIKKIENNIREGEGLHVAKKLHKFLKEHVSRNDRLQLASFARRVHLPNLALRFLGPIIRPQQRCYAEPTDAERVEYAASLIKVGATGEALQILHGVDEKLVPDTLLYQSFALVAKWEYLETIPLLTRYISLPGVTDYHRLIGRVNLAAALVYENRYPQADTLLHDLLRETAGASFRLLRSNTLQLLAQNAVSRRDWMNAQEYLHLAEKTLAPGSEMDQLFIQKWKIFVSILRSPKSEFVCTQLSAFKAKALDLRHWETIRECDRFEALATRNETLLWSVFFGTPYSGYRNRLLLEYGSQLSVPKQYLRHFSDNRNPTTVVDLFAGQVIGSAEGLKVGQLVHKALVILASDFYHPFNVGALYHHLYPNQYYNTVASPVRIYDIIRRLKRWLRAANVAIRVEEYRGQYFLQGDETSAVLLSHREVLKDRDASLLERIREKWPDGNFSVTEISQFLDVSPATALRLVNKAIAEKKVLRTGGAGTTRYSFFAPQENQLQNGNTRAG